jgi:hypothetical protein
MLRKKFFGGAGVYSPPVPVDGAFGIFTSNATSTTHYNYTPNTTVNGTSFVGNADRMSAVGNSSFGITVAAGASAAGDRYTYSSGLITVDGPSPSVSIGSGSASITQSTFGYVFPNLAGTPTGLKYIFSSNTRVAGTAATVNLSSGAGASGANFGIVAMGGSSTTTNKYTYASDLIVAGTSLVRPLQNGGACGNVLQLVFAMGGAVATTFTNKFLVASETCFDSTALISAASVFQSTGNSSVGVMSMRSAATTHLITYASDGRVAGTSLKSTPQGTSNVAMSNGNLGIL